MLRVDKDISRRTGEKSTESFQAALLCCGLLMHGSLTIDACEGLAVHPPISKQIGCLRVYAGSCRRVPYCKAFAVCLQKSSSQQVPSAFMAAQARWAGLPLTCTSCDLTCRYRSLHNTAMVNANSLTEVAVLRLTVLAGTWLQSKPCRDATNVYYHRAGFWLASGVGSPLLSESDDGLFS